MQETNAKHRRRIFLRKRNRFVGIKSNIASILSQIEQFKKEVIAKVEKMPDNPKIRRINSCSSCYIINSSDLENNWSPEYYDNKYQAQVIVSLIKEKKNPESILKMFEEIVNEGTYRITPNHRMHFNNQVRKYLENMI